MEAEELKERDTFIPFAVEIHETHKCKGNVVCHINGNNYKVEYEYDVTMDDLNTYNISGFNLDEAYRHLDEIKKFIKNQLKSYLYKF